MRIIITELPKDLSYEYPVGGAKPPKIFRTVRAIMRGGIYYTPSYKLYAVFYVGKYSTGMLYPQKASRVAQYLLLYGRFHL